LSRDVLQHDLRLHDEEAAAVDRDDRAVAAAMLAAAAGLGVADDTRAAIGHLDVGVAAEVGEPFAFGDEKALPAQGDDRLCLRRLPRLMTIGREPPDEREQPRLELAAEDR